jgi:hypothetical protein
MQLMIIDPDIKKGEFLSDYIVKEMAFEIILKKTVDDAIHFLELLPNIKIAIFNTSTPFIRKILDYILAKKLSVKVIMIGAEENLQSSYPFITHTITTAAIQQEVLISIKAIISNIDLISYYQIENMISIDIQFLGYFNQVPVNFYHRIESATGQYTFHKVINEKTPYNNQLLEQLKNNGVHLLFINKQDLNQFKSAIDALFSA